MRDGPRSARPSGAWARAATSSGFIALYLAWLARVGWPIALALAALTGGALLWQLSSTGALRRWLAALRRDRSRPIVIGLLLLAALFRVIAVPGVTPGATLRAAEGEALVEARRMLVSGDFRPRAPGRPSLLLYGQVATGAVAFLVGASAGRWATVGAMTADDLAASARLLNATLGVVAVAITYATGRRLFGERAGLLATGLLAASPLAWMSAYAASEDALVALVALVAFAGLATALEDPDSGAARGARDRLFLAVALATGFAVGIRLSLLVLVPAFVAVACRACDRGRGGGGGVLLLVGLGGFLAATAPALAALPSFLDALGRAAARYELRVAPETAILLARHLPESLALLGRADPLLTLAGGLGAVLVVAGAATRAVPRAEAARRLLLLVVLLPALVLALLNRALDPGQFVAYAPLLALLGGLALDTIWSMATARGRWRAGHTRRRG